MHNHKTCGEYLVELLQAYEVEHVFGIPGVHTVELYRGLPNTDIKHHAPRHEQGAGFMADGYARVSGKPGVCFIITGPGMTNIVTAMAQAYADSIPMLVISAVNATTSLGQNSGFLHELPNQQALVSQVSAFSHTLLSVDDLPTVMARAFAVFDSERPRPVHIEIPLDVIVQSAEELPAATRASRATPAAANPKTMVQAVQAIDAAEKCVICVGGGAKLASAEVKALAEKIDAPVIPTVNARGILPPDHSLLVSASPTLTATRALIDSADVVIALGTEMGRTDYDFYDSGEFAVSGTLVRADIDPQQLYRNCRADIGLTGDARTIAQQLADAVSEKTSQMPREAATTRSVALDELPGYMRDHVMLLNRIRDALPDAILVGDSSQQAYAGALYFAAQTPSSWFNSATGYGTLGYALPASVGAKLAAPNRPVLCLVGDGGLQFSIAELASAVDAGTPLVILLWNNSGYGEIKAFMLERDIPVDGVDLFTPDFLTLAKAYGVHAETLESLDAIEQTLHSAVERNALSLIQMDEKALIPNPRLEQ
ncbi:MAG: 5-guanidino-2-oxopentanoate decarboxylase [Pseudomonadota bacterium]